MHSTLAAAKNKDDVIKKDNESISKIIDSRTPNSVPFYKKSYNQVNESLLKSNISNMSTLEIDSLLKVLLVWDQKFREKLVFERSKENNNSKAMGEYGDKMEKVDSVNFILFSSITKKIGWPSNQIFSDSATTAAYIILLHNKSTDLSTFEDIIKEAFSKKEIDKKHYGVLMDRIAILGGKKQKFGTHCKKNKDGSVRFFNLSDISKININREKIGLDSFNLSNCELMAY